MSIGKTAASLGCDALHAAANINITAFRCANDEGERERVRETDRQNQAYRQIDKQT